MQKTIIHPFVPAMVNHTEKWLSRLSSRGLVLVDIRGWKFVFDERRSDQREYFMCCSFDASKGFSYDFCCAKERYGTKSKLNKLSCPVFEVDKEKKDHQYLLYRHSRDQYYKKHYRMLFAATALLFVLSALLKYTYFAIPLAVAMVYNLCSLLILHITCDQYKRKNNE